MIMPLHLFTPKPFPFVSASGAAARQSQFSDLNKPISVSMFEIPFCRV